MATSGLDLLARAKKFRDVEELQHPNVPDVKDLLEKACKFLQDHETPSANDCTHLVFDSYTDWYHSSKPSHKLAIAEDTTLETLWHYISALYDLGIPLTLTEKRTSEIRFIQDIEVWGSKDEAITAEELLGQGAPFAQLLGKVMGEVYTNTDFLDCAVFDATGISRTKGVMKTSLRLVWPNVIVDRERAARIRDFVVHKFTACKDEALTSFEKRMVDWNKENTWVTVFSDAIYFSKQMGVRMPLCDRVSPAPMKKPENRPFKPFAVVRFNFSNGELTGTERVCDANHLEGFEWLKIGHIRKDLGTPLTEWTAPTWKGDRAPYKFGGVPAGRQAGQVKIRSKGGSENGVGGGGGGGRGGGKPREPRDQPAPITVERSFDGTTAQFKEQMEQVLGSGVGEYSIKDGVLSWRQEKSAESASVEFKESNKRVYLIGKPHQIRSLLNVITPFVQTTGDARSSAQGTARSNATSHRDGNRSAVGSMAPSAVYAPSAVFAPSAACSPSAYGGSSASVLGGGARLHEGPVRRVVGKAFKAESAGELTLQPGDIVEITHDPEAGQANTHRWVYGSNESTAEKGWFPNSHTAALEETADQIQE